MIEFKKRVPVLEEQSLPLQRHFVTCYDKSEVQIGYDSGMGEIRIALQDKVYSIIPLKQLAGMFEVILRHDRNNSTSPISCYANEDVTLKFDPKTKVVEISILDIKEELSLSEFTKALLGTLQLWRESGRSNG